MGDGVHTRTAVSFSCAAYFGQETYDYIMRSMHQVIIRHKHIRVGLITEYKKILPCMWFAMNFSVV